LYNIEYDEKRIMDCKWLRILKEGVMVFFEVVYWHSSEEAEIIKKNVSLVRP
jgi:hypothetical protein